MYDISLYGHLVFDNIEDGNKDTYSIGGIVNVWKALKEIDRNLCVYVCPTNIGKSHITIDRKNSLRQSLSVLNENDVCIKIKQSTISHIAYLNEIPYPSFIHDLKGCVTADICSGKKIDISLFPNIKLLFVSEEDIGLIENLHTFKETLVIHGPKASSLNSGHYYRRYLHSEYLENINVLGAGDYFAAIFISNMLNRLSDSNNLIDSHIKTTQYLKDRNGS